MLVTRGYGGEWLITQGYGQRGWTKVRRVMRFVLKAYREMILNVFLPGENEDTET